MRDPYLYDDCDVLKNKPGIKNSDELDQAEVDLSCERIHALAFSPLLGNYDFEHFCKMHEYIFGDLYEWAGHPRTISMEKEEEILGYTSIEYSTPDNIEKHAQRVLDNLNGRSWAKMPIGEQAEKLAKDMADLWKVHCFREGNTRTTVTFICQFADSHNMPIDRSLLEQHAAYVRSALVAANAIFKDGDFRKPQYLIKIIENGLENCALTKGTIRSPQS